MNFRTLGGSYLVMVNGVDVPRIFDGTTVSDPAYRKSDGTSIPDTGLIHVSVYNERLYFTERDSARIWYMPVRSVSGNMDNLTGYDFSSFLKRGGYVLWTSAWSTSGGVGVTNYFVVMSNMGECLIYQGLYPAAPEWALVTQLFFPPPLASNTGSNDTSLGRRISTLI